MVPAPPFKLEAGWWYRVHWPFTGVGDSAELIQLLPRDILSVYWACAGTHRDAAVLENGCDVSIMKQHFRFSRET